jgi:hypothetical protein
MEAYKQIINIKNQTLNLTLPDKFKNSKVEVIVLSAEKQTTKKKRKPSEFRGCISKETAKSMLKHVEESKKEWNRNI